MKCAADIKRDIEKIDRELDRHETLRINLAWDLKQRESGRSYGHKPLHFFVGAMNKIK